MTGAEKCGILLLRLRCGSKSGNTTRHSEYGASHHKEREVLFVYAVIVTGGKQYKVSEGDVIFVETLEAEEGSEYTFREVLAVSGNDGLDVGKPTVAGATVKSNEKKKTGHRQAYTKVQITAINA